MANQNGKGPLNKGPRTGRGLGKCPKTNSITRPSSPRRGTGTGRGLGRRTGVRK